MKFNVSNIEPRLAEGLKALSNYFDFSLCDCGINLTAVKGDRLDLNFDGKTAQITYNSDVAFYRAIGHILQANGPITKTESSNFNMCGAMYDHSRNGVLNMEYTKMTIARLAMLGMNTYLMYMEDTYQVEGEKLFGYMRGAYSPAELKEIDDFAYALGIEVVPCIQTLAHLNCFLRHTKAKEKYHDIDDVMEVGKPEVLDLIDRMFSTLSKCFRSKKMHAGMDEAYAVGRGKYLDHNGYQTRKEVMKRHIEAVSEIAKKYDYYLLVWDDMFYRGEGSELSGIRPDNMHIVYWNYYDETEEAYLDKLDVRLADDPDAFFAGGAWRWGTNVPCHRKTVITTEKALSACLKRNVRNVFTTSWGDDGNETPVECHWLGITMFAEHNYSAQYDADAFKAKLQWLTGMSYDEWMLQDDINNFANCENTNTFEKIVLLQDPLCGMHDAYARDAGKLADLTAHYTGLADKFEALAARNDNNTVVNEFYAALCHCLALKWNLGISAADAYLAGDKAALKEIADKTVPALIDWLDKARIARLNLWMFESKLEGFEILDSRFGMVMIRCRTLAHLINMYLEGKIDKIEPLEKERIHTRGEENSVFRMVAYSQIFSAGVSW